MEEPGQLAYDLRQRYALIVGDHLDEISNARRNRDYPEYFKSLENLFTIIKHKFKAKKTSKEDEEAYEFTEEEDIIKEVAKEDKKEKKTDLERYKIIRQKAIDTSNKYTSTFLGRTEKPEEIAKVEASLREMEMFLYFIMDKAKMFGSVGFNEGM